MNIKKSIVLRARIAFLAVFLFSVAVVVKLVMVQVVQGEKWRKLAQENVMRPQVVKATRGNIYSDNGSLLATSLPFYKVAIDPFEIDDSIYTKQVDSLCILLSNTFKDRTWREYKNKIADARAKRVRYLVLHKDEIDYQRMKAMSSWPVFRAGKFKGGVIFEKVEKRYRPFAGLAMRTVGLTDNSNNGIVGLEKSFNQFLAGRDGKALFRRLSGNHWKPMHDDSEIRPKPGVDIQTTIDINLQDVAETSLENHLKQHDADKGCVILMEVATGHIKAIANLGKMSNGEYGEIYNYAVGSEGLTEPGSTFKAASMIALFEENPDLQLTDTVETGNGVFEFYDKKMTDAKEGGYGKITVQQIFEKSSNIGVSRLVNEQFGLKPQKYVDYIYNMGLADGIDFQLKGEAKPFIKKTTDKLKDGRSAWSGVTLPWMSIGYELKLAPVHTLAFYNAIANNGKMIQPIIVTEVRMADEILEKYESNVLNEQICSEETLDKMKKMLEGVVERGTAKNISNTIYKIAGKTGTAQRIVNGQYTKTYYTSFVGYFPADKPKYSCIVVIDNPKGVNVYGSDVAAPVFKEVADKIYSRDLDIHEAVDKPLVAQKGVFPKVGAGYFHDLKYLCDEMSISSHLAEEGEDWVDASPTDDAIFWKPKPSHRDLMPDVTGMSLRDALYILENRGLSVKFSGSGRVMHQSIDPGTRVLPGNQVFLTMN